MNPAAVAAPVEDIHGDGRWMSLHHRFMLEAKEGEPDVLFIGDSIVAQLGQTELWKKMFVPLHCFNFGIGGDCTQHVLWRIQNGELEDMSPKVIVVCVGTNNHAHAAAQVAEGIVEITNVLVKKQPQATILVMGIPPRGEKHNRLREKIAEINLKVEEKLTSISNAIFLKTDPGIFLNPSDSSISHHDMYDYLHLTEQGYQKFCDPLLDELQNLLKSFVKCAGEGATGED